MLNGELAIVTGAGSGIGRATALRLVRDGAVVGVLDIDGDAAARTHHLLAQAGGTAVSEQVDISDPDEVTRALDQICRQTAMEPSILINNAGISRRAPLTELSLEIWQDVFRVNVVGTFVCTKDVARRMIAADLKGRIVVVSSINSEIVSFPGFSAYASSKAAVRMFTKTAALDLAEYGIRVNGVAPGTIETHLTEPSLRDPKRRRYYEERTLVGRLGAPEDVADVISFLVSDDSRYMSGATLFVDGGRMVGV